MTQVSVDLIFINELVEHFRENELIDLGEEGKAYSTRHRCNSVLNKWILPRWKATGINDVRTIDVERWLRSLTLARGTKAKIRKTFNLLFNHAIRWQFAVRNPISGPVRGSGVRQSEKRERIPEILTPEEFPRLEAVLRPREGVLVCLALSSGLRRGELAALRWQDIDFERLTITVQRSLVDQVVGRTKTEASQRPLPMRPTNCSVACTLAFSIEVCTTRGLRLCDGFKSRRPKRGRQPVWLAKVMQYHIQPVAVALGITKKIGWHTLRHSLATSLHGNGEDIGFCKNSFGTRPAKLRSISMHKPLPLTREGRRAKSCNILFLNCPAPDFGRQLDKVEGDR